MEIVIALFFLTIVLLIVIPTLPESRRVRIVLAIVAVPGILCAYGVLEKFASTGAGNARLDYFIRKCDHLLSQGKTAEVRDVLQDYSQQRGKPNPESTELAIRAHMLYQLIREKELQIELSKRPEK